MKQIFFRAMSYLQIFMMGAYATSHFRYNEPIEMYKWAITIFFFFFWITLINDKPKNYYNQTYNQNK